MTALDLLALEDLALAAGREIMAVYATNFETTRKTDGSPVTIADRRAEALILEGLSRLAPGVPVVAEEEMEAGRLPPLRAAFFLVDPLDGTRDFVERRAGEFTVNIGLIENGAPTVGVVYAPATGQLYSGDPGGAFRTQCTAETARRCGERTRIRCAPQTALRVLTSRTTKSEQLDRLLARLDVGARQPMSSSVKFCLIAAGDWDLYPRLGQVNEWDVAAGHAILAAAGGGVIARDGGAMSYGKRAPDFLVNGFFAHAGGAAEAALRTVLAA
ncbi:MAG: 3'(2'),5'-bisphosphate nucleotidase CysQ [Hyphomonadaceae bacterium]